MRFRNAIWSMVLAVLALALFGCASTGRYPEAPKRTDASMEHVYKIGPMDGLTIVVWRNPELSSNVTVRPDGRLSLPLVEDLTAAGRTPSELAREIEKSLAKYIRDPVVSVVVSNFQGTYAEQIRIVGEAARPQAVPYRQNMTVLDVMIQAGGLTDYADGNAAVLVRGGGQNGHQFQLRLKDLLKRGDISANAEVQPGDIIIVPQSWF